MCSAMLRQLLIWHLGRINTCLSSCWVLQVTIIPIIAKADSMTIPEIKDFKRKIMDALTALSGVVLCCTSCRLLLAVQPCIS